MSDAADQPVSFELPGPEYEQATWLQSEHGAASSTPLARTIPSGRPSTDDSTELPTRIHVNSYMYMRAEEWPLKSTLPSHLQDEELPKDDSNLLDWRERCLPLIDEVVAEFEAFDPETVAAGEWRAAIERQQARSGKPMQLVHSTAVFEAQMFSETFAAEYISEYGPARQAEGLAFTQGFPNFSTERAATLWGLGRIARRSPEVMSALDSGKLPVGDSDLEAEFRTEFDSAMETYGHMNPLMMEDMPTWREDVSVPLAIVRQYASEGEERNPRKVERDATARRIELEAELSEAAKTSDAAADLLKLLPYAQHVGAVTEDHNLLADQKIYNASRTRWLKIGEMLRSRGAVQQAGDVYYYEFDELIALLESDTRLSAEEIASRREQLARWRGIIPPAVLGKGAMPEVSATAGDVVSGMAAAAGTYTGRARVITVVTEADSLEEGDVLVCDLTTPSWTPYFAVIGAVVTNIGSVLAHGAIVAREFGIPAVVATGDGTVQIPDGATVTVDGTAGTVTVVSV